MLDILKFKKLLELQRERKRERERGGGELRNFGTFVPSFKVSESPFPPWILATFHYCSIVCFMSLVSWVLQKTMFSILLSLSSQLFH